MTYHAGSRLVTSVEGAVVSTYTFDANGNQTAVNAGGSRTTYAYDYENRMRTAIDPGGARSTMAYWADGMRRFLEVGGTRTTFVWDGSDYLQTRTPSEVTTFSTIDEEILDSETGGSESLLVPDPLGSVVKVLDASGNQVYDAAYWPYGEIRDSAGVNDTSWGYVGTWGYHFDTSRRLYVRARVLDPVTGRWYSVDPMWPKERAFQYAMATPSYRIDPSGMACPPPACTKCTDKIQPGAYLEKPVVDLVECLKGARDRDAIAKCLSTFGSGVSDQAWDALKDFIACTVASALARGNSIGIDPGCDPCKSGLSAPDTQWCCYGNFLKCLFDCAGKKGSKLALCITKCQNGKGGFIVCGFAEAM